MNIGPLLFSDILIHFSPRQTINNKQSTDTGDYFPEDYENTIDYSEGMMGSQSSLGGNRDGPELPGMENLGADAIMMGGIEQAEGIPPDIEFVPSSVPDGEVQMQVAGSGSGMC